MNDLPGFNAEGSLAQRLLTGRGQYYSVNCNDRSASSTHHVKSRIEPSRQKDTFELISCLRGCSLSYQGCVIVAGRNVLQHAECVFELNDCLQSCEDIW
jgi:hypothetical protein